MNKLFRKIIAFILVLILLSANMIMIGEYTIAYALSDEELNEQTAETNHDNVEFNAYFTGNRHIATFDVGSSEAKLYVQLRVNSEGYLENGVIEFQNTNFKISQDITNSNIQSIDRENNRITLNRITNGSTVTLELPIEIFEKESISEDYFNKETLTKFTGTYMDGRGRETEISKEVTNKFVWKNTAEVEVAVEATKFIPFATDGNYGVLLQTKINTKVKDNVLPVKNSNIEITVPTINNTKPTSVTIVATSTESTNGKNNGLEFTNSNYSYDAGLGKISINTVNNVSDVSWKKNVSDEYLVNYIFTGQEIYNYADANGVDSAVTVIPNISVYNGEETTITKTITTPIKYEEKNGAITDFKVELPSDISKGYIYSNFDTDAKMETEYFSKFIATINAANLVTAVEFIQDYDKFLTEEDAEGSTNVSGTNYAYNKRVEISQEIFNKMLGEDGVITVKDTDGTDLGQINKDTQLTYGKYVLDISDKNSNSLDITTSAPITEGQIEIDVIKALKGNIGYSKEQMKDFVKLSAHLQGKTNTTTFESTTQTILKEPETKVELEINKTDFTTVLENENVEIRAVLDTSNIYNALFKNPTLKITFPTNVEKVTLNSTNLVLDTGLKVKSAKVATENGCQVINVELEGIQTEYAINAEYKGAIVILNTDITISTLTPSGTAKITMKYENKSDVATKSVGTIEQTINYIAPSGITTASGISNYKDGSSDILTISDEPQTVEIDTYSDARTSTMSGIIINNYQNDISEIIILGRIPAQGNKVIDSETDMGSNFTIPLSTGIGISGVEATNYTIYYSDNQNATRDLSSSNNGWGTTPTTLSKSYMVVFNNSYKLEAGKKIEFSYDLSIPANLNTDNNAFGMYKVYYTNNSEIGSVKESKVAAIIGLTTGKGPKLSVELNSTVDTIREGQLVEMEVTVNNVGEMVANNVNVNITAPEHTELVEYKSVMGFISVDNNSNIINIGSIEPGETTKISYFLRVNNMISIPLTEEQLGENFDNLTEEEQREIISANTFPVTIKNKVMVTVDGISGEISSNECQLNIQEGEIALEMISDVSETQVLKQGEMINYTIKLSNISGTGDLTNTVVTMPLPEGIKYVSGTIRETYMDENGQYIETTEGINYNENTNVIQINIGTLSNRKNILLKLEVEKHEGNILTMVTAKADGTEENYSNIIEYQTEIIRLEVGELTSTPRYVKEGQELTYILKITNNGKSKAYNVEVSDQLPNGVEFVEATYIYAGSEQKENNLKDGKVKVVINQIEPGETIEIKVKVQASLLPDENDKEIENKMSVSAIGLDSVETNIVKNIIEYSEEAHQDSENQPSTTSKRYKISGVAWLDENKNGKYDSNEQVLSDISVMLLNKGANEIVKDPDTDTQKTTKTLSNGKYEFTNVPKGEYIVVFLYDASKYSLTEYKEEDVDEAYNSDVVDINIIIDGKRTIAATTDIITITNDNVRDINIGLYSSEKFDLKLEKSVSKISLTTPTIGTKTYNYSDSQVAKVEVLGRNLGQSSIVIEYKIKITNEGAIAGYAKKIVDYLPKGVGFSTELNPDWYLSDNGNVYNASLENDKIAPGETREIKLIITKQLTEESLGILSNTAEIYESYNEQGLKDIDSTPANKAQDEDDLSVADIVLSLVTGKIIMYTSIALVVIVIIGLGAFIIKKKVLNKR